jgi:HlyD family secretion protein
MLYAGGGLLALLLIAGGLGWGLGWFGNGGAGLQVKTEQAERRTITQTVTAFGRAQPEVEVTITPDVSGEIVELPVQEGDAVQKGDLLARLKPDDYRAQLEEREAQVAQQKANLARRRADSVQARQAFERKKKLYEKGVIPESEFENARSSYRQAVAQLEAARYRVESAQASLRDAREQLQKTRLYAPMDGTVSKLEVEVGERVVGTRQRSGTNMNIARLDQMELEVDVNETDVVKVADRDTARLEFDAYADRTFQGRVTEIANSARIQNQGSQNEVTNFPVTIRVLGDPNTGPVATGAGGGVARPEVPAEARRAPTLRPGMSGSVDIYTETAENAVAVPIQAVTVRDFADVGPEASADTAASGAPTDEDLREVVFVAEADSARMVEVTTGIADDTHMEIKAGLSGDETIITGPYSAVSRELEPGTKIQTQARGGRGGQGEPLASAE